MPNQPKIVRLEGVTSKVEYMTYEKNRDLKGHYRVTAKVTVTATSHREAVEIVERKLSE